MSGLLADVLWVLATLAVWGTATLLVVGVWVAAIEFNGWRHR